jgi:hypothetical protein
VPCQSRSLRLTRVALAAALFAWAAPTQAQRLLVLPASGAGVSAAALEQGAERLGERLKLVGFEVRVVPGPARPLPPADAEAGQVAQTQQAHAAVLLHVQRSGWGTHVWLRVLDAGGGLLRHQDTVTLALSEPPAALELVFQGMAERLAATRQPAVGARGGASAAVASGRPRDPGALALFASPRFGGFAPVNDADGSHDGVGMFGLSVGAGTDRWKAELIAETSGPRDQPRGFRSGGIGGLLLSPGQSSFAMYGATSLRWSFTQLGGTGADGLVVQPGLGALISVGNSRRFAFRFELGYFVNLFRELTPDRLVPEPPHLERGHGVTVLLGALVQP